jgi:hypothetical protein
MDYFETEFRNSRSTVVDVFECGRVLLTLQPGESKFVESRDPKTSYAPWYRIAFANGDKIRLEENRSWRWQTAYPGLLMLEVLNVDGCGVEGFYVDQKCWDCYKGIPRYIPVSLRDTNWCFVAKIERRLVEHKERDGDYIVRKNVLEDVKTMRSKKEIREIEKQLLNEAAERAKQEMERRFLKPQETPESAAE